MTKLKRMREKKGYSQKKLSELTGINFRTLQNYEQGVLNFDNANIEKIFKVALVLDCDVEDIITDGKIVNSIVKYQQAET